MFHFMLCLFDISVLLCFSFEGKKDARAWYSIVHIALVGWASRQGVGVGNVVEGCDLEMILTGEKNGPQTILIDSV